MLGTAVVGSAGVGLNQIFIWPQVRRALTGVEGVATLTVLGGLFARASWTLYGIRLGDPILIVGNALVAGGFLLLFAALVHYSARRGFLVAQAVVVVAAAAAAAATAGTTVIGWTAASAASAVYLPQMLRTMKEPRRASGVSVDLPAERGGLRLLVQLRLFGPSAVDQRPSYPAAPERPRHRMARDPPSGNTRDTSVRPPPAGFPRGVGCS